MLSHANIMSNVLASAEALAAYPEDVALTLPAVQPRATSGWSIYRYLWTGMTIYYAESLTTVARDLARVRPTIMAAVPRVFEKVHATIREKVAEGPAHPAGALRVGHRASAGVAPAHGWTGRAPGADRPPAAAARRRAGAAEGAGDASAAASASSPRGARRSARHVAEFFFALGVTIIEGYGLTETSPVLSTNPLERVKIGTVGPPLPGVELRIGDHGEILARGPNVMSGLLQAART